MIINLSQQVVVLNAYVQNNRPNYASGYDRLFLNTMMENFVFITHIIVICCLEIFETKNQKGQL